MQQQHQYNMTGGFFTGRAESGPQIGNGVPIGAQQQHQAVYGIQHPMVSQNQQQSSTPMQQQNDQYGYGQGQQQQYNMQDQ